MKIIIILLVFALALLLFMYLYALGQVLHYRMTSDDLAKENIKLKYDNIKLKVSHDNLKNENAELLKELNGENKCIDSHDLGGGGYDAY